MWAVGLPAVLPQKILDCFREQVLDGAAVTGGEHLQPRPSCGWEIPLDLDLADPAALRGFASSCLDDRVHRINRWSSSAA
jgi:hypothetical protein